MGGYSYDRDVGSASSSGGGFSSGGYTSSASKRAMSAKSSSQASPKGKILKSSCGQPIIPVIDVTGSNIEFARIIYDKSPMLFGQIEQQGYLNDPGICFCACGDAYCDDDPIQITKFGKGLALDKELERLNLESGGGGQMRETYELVAWHLLNRYDMKGADLPFVFFIADEAPYPYVDSGQIRDRIGGEAPSSDPKTAEVFRSLMDKFYGNVYVLLNKYSGSSWKSKIVDAWREALPAQNVIKIHDEKSVVDVILGIIAMAGKTRDMDGYAKDMIDRGQNAKRIENVTKSLTSLLPAVRTDTTPVPGKGGAGGKKF